MVLNYPVGEIMDSGLSLEALSPAVFLTRFFSERFFGFVAVTLEGYFGMEEGVLFFRGGFAVGAAYSFDKAETAVFGDLALDAFLNAWSAKKGIVDSVKLSRQQVDLILALDERASLSKPWNGTGLEKRIPTEYNPFFAQQASKGHDKVISPVGDMMKKIGLGELAK